MILYHGSIDAVKTPEIRQSERMLDFGAGFYTTANREQAVQWTIVVAKRHKTTERVVSTYEFDRSAAERELTIIRFNKPDEAWLEFVCAHRIGRKPGEPYDMVSGPVADDDVFTTVQLYETRVLRKEEAIERLKHRKLYNQLLFHTEKSLRFCRYIGYETVGGTT
ncbi:MAG: DUF3990 domain-containing protein [Phycisphaerae bacterium]|nr:DUF3990 domain-containing protein [Phycisphaerae bacterium]